MTYIIVDFEATCCDRQSLPRHEMEIIEIGAAAIGRHAPFDVLAEFQRFVRPVRHPRLTPFCTHLTTIEQSDVDGAEGFRAVHGDFRAWFWSFEEPIFCSWGDYDRNQLRQDCRFHGLPFPLSGQHINLKKRFSEARGLTRKYGMAGALQLAGLKLEGTHHRGIDDVRNMARLAAHIFGDRRVDGPVGARKVGR